MDLRRDVAREIARIYCIKADVNAFPMVSHRLHISRQVTAGVTCKTARVSRQHGCRHNCCFNSAGRNYGQCYR